MTVTRWPTSIMVVGFALALAAFVFLLEGSPRAAAVQGKKDPDLTTAKFVGASKCAFCHAQEEPKKGALKNGPWPADLVKMSEFRIWRGSDKHALAYAVLEGPRGKQMAGLLKYDVTKSPKCLNCHSTTSRPEREGDEYKYFDGVSCDGCHGPGEHWVLAHFTDPKWRKMTPEDKEKLGMFDVRNPVKRTQMCMSCHVGNTAEGKVVTHEMMAAGHPPLPSFETASFSKNLPQHWWDLKDVGYFKNPKTDDAVKKQNYMEDAEFQHTKLVLASCSQSMRAMSELVANRASLVAKDKLKTNTYGWPPPWLRPHAKNDPNDRWPELPKATTEVNAEELQGMWPEIAMAQTDCFSCHHDLKSKAWRQLRGYMGKPGRPQIQPWPFALAPAALTGDDAEFKGKLKGLFNAMDSQPFGTPADVAIAARDLENFAAKLASPTAIMTKDKAGKLLEKLLARGSAKYVDYDSARQIAWASRAVFAEWGPDHAKKKEIEDLFAILDDELNLSLQSKVRKSAEKRYELTKKLGDPASDFEAKVKDKQFLASLQKVNDEELNEALAVIANYDPEQFQGRMTALSALIKGKGE